jgi:rhodanese-related sulfurtransferase
MKIKNYFKNYNLIIISLAIIIFFFVIYFVFAKNDNTNSNYRNIGATEAQKIITSNTSLKVLDVRTKEEYEEGHIAGATNLDFYGNSFKNDLSKLNKDDTYLVYCRSGNRSGQTLSIMKDLGFKTFIIYLVV